MYALNKKRIAIKNIIRILLSFISLFITPFILLNLKFIFNMKKCPKKETLWKFIAKDSYNSLYLELPGLLKIFKYFLILIAISPWIFILLFRIDIRGNVKDITEWIFGINEKVIKNQIDFFMTKKS